MRLLPPRPQLSRHYGVGRACGTSPVINDAGLARSGRARVVSDLAWTGGAGQGAFAAGSSAGDVIPFAGTLLEAELRKIIIGGPGRSGTTYLAAALGQHPDVASFEAVELKFLFELGGLTDLGWVLCRSFSPNRAWVAIGQFRRLVNQLRNGGYDQPLLSGSGLYGGVGQALDRFLDRVAPDGVAQPMEWLAYRAAASDFFHDIVALATRMRPGATHFLEKTPHNLLAPNSILEFVGADAQCIHLIRDPRATALSLVGQAWGPSTLPAAIAWVKSYYRQWAMVRQDFRGLDLVELRIEDMAADPHAAEAQLLAWLGLRPHRILGQVDTEVLADRMARVDAADRALLDARLGDLASHLEYGSEKKQRNSQILGHHRG